MQHMVAANAQPVPVPGNQPDIKVRINQLDPGGKARRPAMDGMKTVGRDIIGKARGTANPRHKYSIFRLGPAIRQRHLNRLENSIIATTGAPAYFLIGFKILE